MRYDPIADFAYHLGYSYGEAVVTMYGTIWEQVDFSDMII